MLQCYSVFVFDSWLHREYFVVGIWYLEEQHPPGLGRVFAFWGCDLSAVSRWVAKSTTEAQRHGEQAKNAMGWRGVSEATSLG